jgi:hypothetical protein
MFFRSVILLTLIGIALGLFVGMLDSFLHFVNFEGFKVVNIIVFVLFFVGVYWSVAFLRERLKNGIISYMGALRNTLYVGVVAAIIISAVRYVYLTYIIKIDIAEILDQTKESMLNRYSLYSDEIINNRLSFIEFSYDPIVSSLLYFAYYLVFVIVFAFLASFVLRRIDRNISI